MKRLKIGKVAKETGVTVQTLRFYEREGLLAPPRRSEGGFRLYDEDAVVRVRFIRDAQALGFSLAEIAELLSLRARDDASCAQIREVVAARLEVIEEKLAQLQRMRDALVRLAAVCPGDVPAGDCPVITFIEE